MPLSATSLPKLGSWAFDEHFQLSLHTGTIDALREIDTLWTPLRNPESASAHWRWEQLASYDVFIISSDSAPLVVWASKRRTVRLGSATYYDLSYYEVHPEHLGKGFGSLGLALVCLEAEDLGAAGVVIYSVDTPEALGLYESAGAIRGVP